MIQPQNCCFSPLARLPEFKILVLLTQKPGTVLGHLFMLWLYHMCYWPMIATITWGPNGTSNVICGKYQRSKDEYMLIRPSEAWATNTHFKTWSLRHKDVHRILRENKRRDRQGKIKAGKGFREGNSLAVSLSGQRLARGFHWVEIGRVWGLLNKGLSRKKGKEMVARADVTHSLGSLKVQAM